MKKIFLSMYTKLLFPIGLFCILLAILLISKEHTLSVLFNSNQSTMTQFKTSSEASDLLARFQKLNGHLFESLTYKAVEMSSSDFSEDMQNLKEEAKAIHKKLLEYTNQETGKKQEELQKLASDFELVIIGKNDDGVFDVITQMIDIDISFALKGMKKYGAVYETFNNILMRNINETIQNSEASIQDTSHTVIEKMKVMNLFSIIASIVAVGVALFTALSVMKTINKIVVSTRQLAQGDLTIDLDNLKRSDELGAMIDALEIFKNNQLEIQYFEKEKKQRKAREQKDRMRVIKEQENLIISEIDDVITACSNGDFSKALETNGKDGLLLLLSERINKISSVTLNSILEVKVALHQLSQGNLDYKINAKMDGIFEEIKESFNSTVFTLSSTINAIKGSASTVDTISSQLSISTDDLSVRTEDQASSVDSAIHITQDIGATIRQNASIATEASVLANCLVTTALNGQDIVNNAVLSINEIHTHSKQIRNIVVALDDIAHQTNILAINAAIEAARAGHQGKGFMIVAHEVRSLAEKSLESSQEIAKIVADAVLKIDNGANLVNNSGEALGDIITSINDVTQLIAQVAETASYQKEKMANIVNNITDIGTITQKNSQLAENNTETVKLMAQRATELSKAVEYFKTENCDNMTHNQQGGYKASA